MKRKIKNLTICFFIAVLAAAINFCMTAANDSTSSRTVRVACDINKALYIDEDGNPQGYCKQYLTELAAINNWTIEYVPGSWTDSVERLNNGEIDILFPTQMTEDRIGKMHFSTAIGGYQPIGLFAMADSGLCYDDFEKFDGLRIAVSAGTSNEKSLVEYAKEHDFTYEPVYMNTTADKLEALKNGTVDMIVFSTLNDVEDGKVVAMLDYLPFYYCTRIDETQLTAELEYGMNQMIIRHPDTVQDVFYSFMNKDISFAYTREEQAAVEEHGSIVVGVYKDTAPLFDINREGEYEGIYVDILKRIENLSGLNIEIRALDRSNYAFDILKNGEIDFILGSSDQALKYSGEEDYIQSEGVMDYYSVNITRTDYSYSDNDKMSFALTTGRKYWQSVLKKKYPNADFVYYESSKDCLNAVQKKDADITILNSWEYNYQTKNDKFQNLMEWENSRTLSETVFVSLKSESEVLRAVLNKAIEQIPNHEKESIITANLNKSYTSYTFKDRLYAIRYTLMLCGFIFLVLLVGFLTYTVMRKKAVRDLQYTNSELKTANEAKNIFLSRMSHELRTPLNAINGYATVMLQETENDKNKLNLQAILHAAKYQLSIITDLLDIHQIESGKIVLNPMEINTAEYLQSIVDMVRPEADDKKINFTYERLSEVNDTYFIDGVRLQQVFLNILHNAIKFTPDGGKVRFTADVIEKGEEFNTLQFIIADNGIGMSEEFQKNYLFKSFAQEYAGNTSPYEGCGTGLAISKEIIELMGGTILCKSQKEMGSEFTVVIPAKHIERRKRRTAKPVNTYNLEGIRVLLCEDNPMNQDMEKRLLERMNCQVDIASDGQEGIDIFSSSEEYYYSIILMDIRMPNVDGLDATKAIRALNRKDSNGVPIVAVSANAFEEDIKKSLDAGMNEHLAKPVDVRILYKTIQKYCIDRGKNVK